MASLNSKTKIVTLNGDEVLQLCEKVTQAVKRAGAPEAVNLTIAAGLDATRRIYTVKVFDPDALNAPAVVKEQFTIEHIT